MPSKEAVTTRLPSGLKARRALRGERPLFLGRDYRFLAS
jgi:hypothetical protein